MKASPGLVAFNSGELSPACEGRVDLKQYTTGCFRLQNFIPMVQGPARRRPGTRFVTEVKDSSKRAAITEFSFNTYTSFILEWGDHYVRFYKNHLPVLLAGVPFEIVSPYAATDLFDVNGFFQLVFVESADVVYITHRSSTFPAYKLSHFSDAVWTLAPVVFLGGPFQQTNPGDNPVVFASAETGDSITLTASANIFPASLIGSYFQLTQSDARAVRPWEAQRTVALGQRRSYNGVTYELLAQGASTTTTGNIPPTHLSGSRWDHGETGKGNLWAYRDAGFGFVQITAVGAAPAGAATAITAITAAKPPVVTLSGPPPFVNGAIVFITGVEGMLDVNDQFYAAAGIAGNTFQLTQIDTDGDGTAGNVDGRNWDLYTTGGTADNRLYTCTADVVTQAPQLGVVNRLPSTVVGYPNSTSQWAVGAFNARDGYPIAVSFFRGRLCFAVAGSVYLSVSADFENFSALTPGGLVTADMAITVTLPTQDVIQWMVEGRVLVVGTASAEHVITEINTGQPLGPANIATKAQMRHGSRAVRPVLINESLIWAQTSGQKIRIMKYQFYTDQYQSEDLAALANHIFEQYKPLALAYQQEPDSVIWMVRTDGQLIGFTFNEEQGVIAWHRHPTRGAFESLAVIPAHDGSQDELWVLVRRTINGVTRRYIEYLAPHFVTGDSLVTDALYSDSGSTYNGAPTNVITGLGRLEGLTVKVLTDGAQHADCVVTGGQITLNWNASIVQVGLPQTAWLTTMPLEAGATGGTAQAKIKRISTVNVRFLNTLGGELGYEDPYNELSLPGVEGFENVEMRAPVFPMNQPVPIYNGLWPPQAYDFNFPGGYEAEGRITYRNDTPYPCTVAAIYPTVTTED